MKPIYITTPIYYPNSKPHLGSAYTTILADFFARLYRNFGFDSFFLTGTDEHGEKLERKAKELGKTTKQFVDEMAEVYKSAWKLLKIEPNRFIRTTDSQHEETIKMILKKLWEKKQIYKGKYEGLYCIGCERYYTKNELIDGKCPYHLKEPEHKSIDAYFFKLSEYKDKLKQFYKANPKFLPKDRAKEILNRIEDLQDLCISRPKKQLKWGIELPFDNEHVAYVWVDALFNYLSGSINQKGVWPPDLQFMGKDIMWFHCVIWPSLLMAVDFELPRREIVHGFINVNGQKMSKSLGNVIDPLELARKYGADFVRYLLIMKLPFGDDGNIVKEQLPKIYGELAGEIGNLVNRTLKLLSKIQIKQYDVDSELKQKVESLATSLKIALKEYDIEKVMDVYSQEIPQLTKRINSYLNEKEPWKKEGKEKANIILNTYEALLFLLALLKPILVEGFERFAELSGDFEINSLSEFGSNATNHVPKKDSLILYSRL